MSRTPAEPEVLERAALVVGVAIAIAMLAVFVSPSDVALLCVGLVGVCAVAPSTVLRTRRSLYLGAVAGILFALAHVAETGRSRLPSIDNLLGFQPNPLRVWIPAALAVPAFVGLSAAVDSFRSTVVRVHETIAHQQSVIEALALEDPDSGEVQKRPGLEEAQRWLSFADRYGMTLSLALVGVDEHPDLDGQERSRPVGEYLEQSVRETDSVTRYDDHVFLVALPYTVRDEATAMVKRLARDAIDRAGRTVRGSTVEYGRDGNDLATLLRNAEAGLQFCRENGLAVADPAAQASRIASE